MTVGALEMLANDLRQQERGHGRHDEGDERETERVRQQAAVAALPGGEGREELRDT